MVQFTEVRTDPVAQQTHYCSCVVEEWPSNEAILLKDDPFAICWNKSLACVATALATIALVGLIYYSTK